MSESGAAPPTVGTQLARRRKSLDIPQGTLATMASVTVTSISKAENDLVAIRRGKRPDWERALRLRPGTISRAYETGSPIEALDDIPPAEPYADMTDEYERAIWQIAIPEEDRKRIIDLIRKGRREGREQHSA